MQFKIPNSIITRTNYLKKVIPFVDKNLIKVFTGQRRVGKSYLLFQIMHYLIEREASTSIVNINKEDLAFSFIQTAQDLQDYVLAQKSIFGTASALFFYANPIRAVYHRYSSVDLTL